jgi:hypothetical protein
VKQSGTASSSPQVARAGANALGNESKKPCQQCQADHGPKWQNCVHDVSKKGNVDNAYAVCTTSVGQKNAGEIHQVIKKPGGMSALLSHQSVAQRKVPANSAPFLSSQKQAGAEEGGKGSGRKSSLHQMKDGSHLYADAKTGTKNWGPQKHLDAAKSLDTLASVRLSNVSGIPKDTQGAGKLTKLADDHRKIAEEKTKKGQKQSGSFNFLSRFKEASATADGQPGKRFRVDLLSEGLGNFKDAFYYTKEAVASAVPIFEGRQYFIDHPDEIEEQTRPERSVRDLAGYFENVSADLQESGITVLTGDLVLLPDPSLSLYRTQMLESLQYSQKHPGQELVGLSINASGDFDTVPIQEFLNSGQIPEACLAKLNEAMQKGVQVIRPVREMSSAVSCDLVTVAGAGGKINQLLEGGKKPMEKKEADQKEAEGADGADGQDGSHPDAEQDEELIKTLMQKYLGDGFSDEDKQMMSGYMGHAKEMGLEGKEAEAMAGHSMKMAKHMMAKQAAAKPAVGADGANADPQKSAEDGEARQAEAEEPAGAAVGVHGDKSVAPAASKNGISKKDQVAESAQGRGKGMTEMVARIARLEQEIEKRDLNDATEKALRESGLSRKATGKFRESVLPTIKTVKQLNEELKKFQEAFKLGSETESVGFVYGAEPTGAAGGTSGVAGGFGDCVEE